MNPSAPAYVYIASSWRNQVQPAVCATLTAAGIAHYDFRHPAPDDDGFSWKDVVPWRPAAGPVPLATYFDMIGHPRAAAGYDADFAAMQRADTFVLVLPCGRSAHLELGWAVGAGKRTAILMEDPVEPELMYGMVDHLAGSMLDLLGWLGVED